MRRPCRGDGVRAPPRCARWRVARRPRYDFYDGELTASLTNGELRGEFKRQLRKDILRRDLRAWRENASATPQTSPGVDLSGDWLLRLENFSAWPTAIFIGRDGRVKRIHAGFEGAAAGARHVQLKAAAPKAHPGATMRWRPFHS